MKNKNTLIYIVCFALISSLIGIKLYTDKKNRTKDTVIAVDTEKNKPKVEVNDTKPNGDFNTSVSGNSNIVSSSETTKLDITMTGTTPNTEGNTFGNLLNGGFFAKQGKWIYFTLPPTNTIQYPIYRAMSDGETGLKAITGLGQYNCINVIGDWVYYLNFKNSYIYRTRTDGSRTEVVVDSITLNMYIKDDFIYYANPLGIYKLGLNSSKGEKATQIAKGSNVIFIHVYNNLIYTLMVEMKISDVDKNRYDSISTLYTMNLDGSNLKKLINENIYKFIIYNNYIFYINDKQKFYKMNLNGSNKIQLPSFNTINLNISNNNIYYSSNGEDQSNIYKSNLDGKNLVKVTNNFYDNKTSNSSSIIFINNIFIIDNNIFYLGVTPDSPRLRRTNLDGSLERQLN